MWTWLNPSVAGARQPRGPREGVASPLHCARRATPVVVLHVYARPYFVTDGS